MGEELLRKLLENDGARVLYFIDPMAEAHQRLFGLELRLKIGPYALDRTNFTQHRKDFFIGAAMQGSLQRSDGRGDHCVGIRQRGRGDQPAKC